MGLICVILASVLAISLATPTPRTSDNLADDERIQSPQNIAFMSYRLEPIEESVKSHEPLLFEGVKHNYGDYFDLDLGYFTAPIEGLYVFNFTSYVTMEKRIRLMKNEYEVRILSKDGKGRPQNAINSNILIQLDAEDRVWLRVAHRRQRPGDDATLNSTLTTFAGRLLTTETRIETPPVNVHHHSKRSKRSAMTSLQREIRDANYLPITFQGGNDTNSIPDVTHTSTNQKIAFSVTCTKSMIGGYMADTTSSLNGAMSPEAAPNGRIGFDKTFVNIGNGFDIENGEFVAPTNGVYFFSFNVGKFPRKKLSVMLMKNFNEVQSIIYNDSKSRAREIQGQSLMLQLREGDRVWLRSYNDKDYAVYSNFGNYITFNGYIVYEL